MQYNAAIRRLPARLFLIVLAAIALTAALPLYGQQSYVSRYDLYTGYAFLDSPKVSLFENGFQLQVGVRPKTWYSLGFDYSITKGDLSLTPDLLPDALQQQLGGQIAQLMKLGIIPPTYQLKVPATSDTQTFAMGPQLSYRHFKSVTLFLRPSVGAIREVSTPNPTDAVSKQVVAELAPSGKKQDWTAFYGFGGGVDLLFSKHVGLRVQADFVHDHLFNDILKDGRNTVRFSLGPCFNFGRNIVE